MVGVTVMVSKVQQLVAFMVMQSFCPSSLIKGSFLVLQQTKETRFDFLMFHYS